MSKTLRGHRWTGWSARRPSLLRPFPVLRVEELEERATPASFTWSGAGGNANWSNAANWQGGSAPTGNPLALDALSFPSGVSVAAHNTINNLNNATFFSISISDPNYTISGKSITLGSATASGNISSTGTNDIVALDIALGAANGSKQFFTVGAGGDLTLSGKISGNTGSIFTKDGIGILVLANDNSNFTGPIQIDNTGGVLRITNSKALGDSVGETTVGTNSTLQVSNVAGSINEPLRLNGPGVSNLGALRSFAGANTWSGTVILDSDATFGAAVGTSVNLTGQISDTGTSRNVTKEDFGEVRFSGSNTYRGSTTINNGVLTAADANALGTADKTTATGTVVNETLSKAGRLQIAGPAGSGFTILNEALVLNGDGLVSSTTNAGSQIPYGFDNYGKGAFYNSTGNNTWAGPVTLGSLGKTSTNYAALGAADGTDIIVSGIVTGGAGFLLEKVEPGRVILNNVNTYKGNTRVYEGILNIRDSGALGAVTATTGLVDVVDGGTLELEVEAATTTPRFGYDQATGNSTGRDLWNDSVTLDPNALTLSNPITINGRGFQNTGALRSRSGINTVTVDVNLDRLAFPFALTGDGSDASIGVDQDLRPGHPSPNSNYFTSDYSLTILGQITGGTYTEFVKRGAGHLILPGANTYQGVTQIEQGWVTIEDNNALGVDIVGLGDTVQPEVYVLTGAALHLKAPSAGAPLDIKKNITIGGTGPTHNYSLINAKGALVNIGGDNTWSGDIELLAATGIGVEQIFAGLPSELTVTGSTLDSINTQTFTGDGGVKEQVYWIDTGTTGTTYAINWNFTPPVNPPEPIADRLTVYYPPRFTGVPATQIYNTGYVFGVGSKNLTFGPGSSTIAEFVMNGNPPGGGLFSLFTITIASPTVAGSLYKYGSQRLRLQGDGTYTGETRVLEGTLRAENDTALGHKSSGTLIGSQTFSQTMTTVSTGAVLETAKGITTNNGGIASGIQIYDERLVLSGSGYQVAVAGDPLSATFVLNYTGPTGSTFSTQPLPVTSTALDLQTALFSAPITTDGETATVTKVGNVFSIVFGTAISKDLQNLSASIFGGAEVKITDGQSSVINVSADNAWRGPITLAAGSRFRANADTRLSVLAPIDDALNTLGGSQLAKRGNGELVLGGANTYRGITLIDEGIVTAANSQAFGFGDGTPGSGTIVSGNAQLQIQGNLTIASEALSVTGTGPNTGSAPTNIPIRWLEVGGAPINNGQTPGALPVTGRVTGTAVDPTDPNVIYISTAGGGAWKTKDGGHTWLPLFDLGSPTAPLRGGAIAVDPSDPTNIYYGTGETNNSGDSYAGTGVYNSKDSGRTWTLITGTGANPNPLYGQSISKIAVQPQFVLPNGTVLPLTIYVGSSDYQVNNSPAGAPGVWRYNGTTWLNLTGTTSDYRATQKGKAPFDVFPPNTPGPDDDYRVTFPQQNVTWTDLAIVYYDPDPSQPNGFPPQPVPVLYASLTEQFGTWLPPQAPYNGVTRIGFQFGGYNSGVFRTESPWTAKPAWFEGDSGATASAPPVPDNRANNLFPTGPWLSSGFADLTMLPNNGRIQLTVQVDATQLWRGTTVYAAVTFPISGIGSANDARLQTIRKSTDSGKAWTVLAIPVLMQDYQGPAFGGQGWYDTAITSSDPRTVYVAGSTGSNVWQTKDGGTNWNDLTLFANSPHADEHALTLIGSGPNAKLIVGGDGGVWTFDPTSRTWNDINGTLAITTFNGIATHPNDYNIAYGGSQDNGTEKFTGSLAWDHIDDGDGGIVQLDQTNPNIVYHILNGTIRKSIDAGATWTTIFFGTGLYYPFVLDQVNPQRLVTSNGQPSLSESLDGGNTWNDLNYVPFPLFSSSPVSIALAQFQGPFNADANPSTGFPNVGDIGSNTYDARTIYVTDASTVFVTKDGGLTWQDRGPGVTDNKFTLDFTTGALKYKNIGPITVTSNTAGVYVTARTLRDGDNTGSFNQFGSAKDEQQTVEVVFPTGTVGTFNLSFTIAAQGAPFNTPARTVNLTNISNTISGAGLLGLINTAIGAYNGNEVQLLQFSNVAAGATFTLSDGVNTTAAIPLPTTAAAINAALSIATPARINAVASPAPNGAFYLTLTPPANTALPLLVAAGSSAEVYVKEVQQGGAGSVSVSLTAGTGPSWTHVAVDPSNRDAVYVTALYAEHQNGPTVFRSTDAGRAWADISGTGLPMSQVGTSQPAWTIVVDARDGKLYVGTDVGTYFSNDDGNTWAPLGSGMPNVQVKDLVLNQTLNTLSAGTYGRSMFQTFLNYAKADFGAIRAVSGNSVWTGPVTLTGNAEFHVDGAPNIQNGITSASLNILGVIGGNFDITKTGQGTLVFSGANTYGGQTFVSEGILQANNPNALGSPLANTIVEIGAALELATDLYLEPITVNGVGYSLNDHNTGSLRNIAGFNTYTGPLTMGTDTTIGVNSGTQLTIGGIPGNPAVGTGSIADGGLAFNLTKELTGTLVLASANTYGGLTNVVQGALRVEDANALGDAANGTIVSDGAQLQISRNNVTLAPTVVSTEQLLLSGTGIFGTGAILNVRGDLDPTGTNDNTWQGPIVLTRVPNFSPSTTPTSIVSLGSSDSRDTLTIDVSIAEDVVFAPFDVNKVGPGRVTFARDNFYSGQTNVNGGSLRVQTVGGLGTGAPGTVVNSGSLELDSTGLNYVEILTLNGDGVVNAGALNNVSGDNSYSGPITLASNTSIGAVGGTTLTVQGLLQDPTPIPVPAARLRKAGAGTVVFPNAKDYGGLTVVDNGILNIRTPLALGNLRSEIQNVQVVATTGTFRLSYRGQTTSQLPFDATALQVETALNALSTIGGVGGSVTVLLTSGAGINTYAVTFGGALANTQLPQIEAIYVSPVVATVQNGSATLGEVQTVRVTASGGNFGLTFNGFTTTAIPVNDPASSLQAALNALPSIGGIGGFVSVFRAGSLNDYTYTVVFGGTLATGNLPPMISAVVGGTLVTTGTNLDGQGGTTVNAGGTLQLEGSMTFAFPATGEIITLNGQGFNPGTGALGALNILNGNVDWTSPLPLLLGSDASIGVTNATDTLTMFGPISDSGGRFDLDIYGLGTTRFAGNGTGSYGGNTYTIYTGTTTVHSGLVLLDVTGSNAIRGPLVVGDGIGAPLSAVVRELQGNEVADTSPVTVKSDGLFDLNGFTETFGNLTVAGGQVVTQDNGHLTTGTITMTGGSILVGDNASLTGGNTNMSAGALIQGGLNSTISLGDLTMDASLINFLPPGPATFSAGNITMTNGSQIVLPQGNFTSLDIYLDGGTVLPYGKISLGDDSTLSARNVTVLNNGNIALGQRDTFTASGAVSVSSNGIIQLDQDGLFAITGNLTLAGGTVKLADATVANKAKLTAAEIAMTGTSVIQIGNNGHLNATGKVSNTGGAIALGSYTLAAPGGVVDFTAGGNVAIVDGSVTFGTSGLFNNQAFDLSLNNSLFQMGNNGTAKTKNVSLSNSSNFTFANTGTLDAAAGNLTMTGGSNLTFLNNGNATTKDIAITGGSIAFLDTGTLAAGNVNDVGAPIRFGNTGVFTAATVTVTGGGSIGFGTLNYPVDPFVIGGTNSTFTATGAVSFTDGDLWMGDSSTAKANSLSLATGSQVTFNDFGTLIDAGLLTLTGASQIIFGDNGKATSLNASQTGGLISFLTNGELDTANYTDIGGAVSFKAFGTFNAATVSVTNGSIGFTDSGKFTTTGNLSLATSKLVLGNLGTVSTKAVTTTGASKIQMGNDGTIDTTTVTVNPGGTILLGNNDKFTAAGTVSIDGSTATFGTDGLFKITGNLSLTNSTLALGTNGKVQLLGTGNATLATASKLTFADSGTLAADGNLTMTGTSKLAFGNFGSASVRDLKVTTGSIAMLDNSSFTAYGLAEIKGATVSLGTTSTFTVNGATTIAVSGPNAASLTLGNIGTLQTGDLTLTTATVTLGANSKATTLDLLVTGTSTVTVGDTSTFNAKNVTDTTGTFAFGIDNKFLITGAASFTNGSVTFSKLAVGGAGGKLAATGDLTADNTPISFYVTNGSVSADDVFLTNKSKLTFFADGGSLTAGTIAVPATLNLSGSALVKFANNGTLTAGATTLTNSTVSGGTNTTVKLGTLASTSSTIGFGDNSNAITGNIGITGGSIALGKNSSLTAGNIVDSGANITLGTTSTFTAANVTVTNGGILLGNTGNGGTFAANDLTLTNSAFIQGTSAFFTTAGNIVLTTSSIAIGAGGTGSAQSISLVTSSISLGAGTTLAISGDIDGNSSFLGGSSIDGQGTIDLGSGVHSSNVGNGDGIDNIDLVITTKIAATSAARLNKSGVGRLQLAPSSTTALGLGISQGDVQVDGVLTGPVQISGGTLSGSGAVGTLTGTSGGPVIGRVAPGANWAATKSGILGSASAVWGPQTTFSVDLSSSIANNPTPGTDYDQLAVAGNIDLGNAVLDAHYGTGILIGDSYTIITYTGTRTGKFNSQDIVFVTGQKFSIDYSVTGSVILHKIRADATITMTAVPLTSTFNQTVTFTATIVPEADSMLIPNTTTVTFHIDGIDTPLVTVGASNQAVYTITSLSVGTHVLTATFNGNIDTFNLSNTPLPNVIQTVQQPTVDPLIGVPSGTPAYLSPNNASSVGVQDQYDLSSNVHLERGTIAWNIAIKNSASTTVRTLSGSGSPGAGTDIAINASWDGKTTGGSFAIDGNYTATVTVNDSFGNTFAAAPIPVVVDNTSPTASTSTPSPILIDPTAASTLPTHSVLTGTVGDLNLSGWVLDIKNGNTLLRQFSGTGTTVNVDWDGKYVVGNPTATPGASDPFAPDAAYAVSITALDLAGNRTTSTTQTVVVLANGPIVTVDTGASTVYGTTFTITATADLPAGSPASLYSLLAGDTINFFQGAASLGTGTLALNGTTGKYQTSITSPILNAGTYSNFKAVYPATADFPLGNSPLASHIVTKALLTVTANDKTRLYGAANPPFTFTATGLVNGDTLAAVLAGTPATTATPASNVGTYPITVGSVTPNGNYQITTFNNGTLSITPAPLTIKVNDATRPLNTVNPTFTYTVLGLLNGDPASVVSNVTLTTTAVFNSPVGSYPITVSGTPTVGSNYTIASIVPGALAITPKLTSFSLGSGAGGIAIVSLYNPDGSLVKTLTPFGSFFGGVRTVTADFNGDGVNDLAVGTGPGAIAQVSVFDGVTGANLFTAFPFETPGVPSFTGGLFVAAGDIDGDGKAELVITPDEGGGPRVIVQRGGTFAPMLSYFGINDPAFRGGARAAVGDLNGDGFADIAVSAGFQGGPRISLWDGRSLASNQFVNLTSDFFAFDPSLRNGAFVAIGDVNGDGKGDLIAGAGPGGAPHVKIFSGADLLNRNIGPARTTPFASFFAGNSSNRGGVRVAAKVLDTDLFVDVITGVGDAGGDTATAYRGADLKDGRYIDHLTIDAFPGLNSNGIFVG